MKAFSFGVCSGIVLMALMLILFELTPKGVINGFYREAVASGHAEWIIETSESGEPEMKFQWKQLK